MDPAISLVAEPKTKASEMMEKACIKVKAADYDDDFYGCVVFNENARATFDEESIRVHAHRVASLQYCCDIGDGTPAYVFGYRQVDGVWYLVFRSGGGVMGQIRAECFVLTPQDELFDITDVPTFGPINLEVDLHSHIKGEAKKKLPTSSLVKSSGGDADVPSERAGNGKSNVNGLKSPNSAKTPKANLNSAKTCSKKKEEVKESKHDESQPPTTTTTTEALPENYGNEDDGLPPCMSDQMFREFLENVKIRTKNHILKYLLSPDRPTTIEELRRNYNFFLAAKLVFTDPCDSKEMMMEQLSNMNVSNSEVLQSLNLAIGKSNRFNIIPIKFLDQLTSLKYVLEAIEPANGSNMVVADDLEALKSKHFGTIKFMFQTMKKQEVLLAKVSKYDDANWSCLQKRVHKFKRTSPHLLGLAKITPEEKAKCASPYQYKITNDSDAICKDVLLEFCHEASVHNTEFRLVISYYHEQKAAVLKILGEWSGINEMSVEDWKAKVKATRAEHLKIINSMIGVVCPMKTILANTEGFYECVWSRLVERVNQIVNGQV